MFQNQLILNNKQFTEIYEYVLNNYDSLYFTFFHINSNCITYENIPVKWVEVDLTGGEVRYALKQEYKGNLDIYLDMTSEQIKTLRQFMKLAKC